MASEKPLPGEASVETVSATTVDEPEDAKAKRKRDEEVLALARKRFRTCEDAYAHFREQALDDTRFRAGTWGDKSFQWNEGIQDKRRAADRPCLTINRAPGFVRQVTNQARQAHLRIIVSPVDDQSDVKTAEVLQGIIHNIESTSFADRAYAAACEKQAEIGLGFFRLITEYADDESFSQVIKIKREKNPLAIFIDPASVEPDTCDAEFAFKVTDLDAETWKELTGKKTAPTASSLQAFDTEGTETGDWFPNGKIRYAEYFSRENKGERRRIAQLSDGTVVPYPSKAEEKALNDIGVRVTKDRYVQDKQMVWRKIDGVTIHEETVWKADTHPWIPVFGDELEVDGEKDYRGVIRDSKESARIYNVEVSALVESVGLGQKAPIVGYRGQFGAVDSKMRKAWETANIQPHAFLEVEPMDIDGKPAPIPQRVPMETNLQGIVVAIHQSDEDYKTTAGFRDASLGERGPQESGKAILARQKQDELGSSHYLDNLRFALCVAGRQLIQLIRVVYDEPTVVRIKGKDEKTKKVLVFAGAEKDPRRPEFLPRDAAGQPMPYQMPNGVEELYDISVGEFDVEVSAMPSSGTRRQEAVEAMTSLFKEMPPELSSKFLDLYFKTMDFPGASQLMERAKKVLPPEFRDDEDGKPPVPPEVQKQMAEMKDHIDKLTQAYQQAVEEIKTEHAKMQGQRVIKQDELHSKERMQAEELAANERLEQMKQRAALIEQQLALKGERALAVLEAELDRMTQQTDLAHKATLADRASADKAGDRAAAGRKHVLDLTDGVLARREAAEQAVREAALQPTNGGQA